MEKRISIESIKIENYRSILDSGEIKVDNRVIALAGKNESGKTNILKSLMSFYSGKFDEDDFPVSKMDKVPCISIRFNASKEYIEEKLQLKNIYLKSNYKYTIKAYSNNTYKISGDIITEIYGKTLFNQINQAEKLITRPEADSLAVELLNNNNIEINEILAEKVKSIKERPELLNNIKNVIVSLKEKMNMRNLIPKFEYFDSFDNILPDEIDTSEVLSTDFKNKYPAIVYLLKKLNVGLDQFKQDVTGNKRSHLRTFEDYSDIITEDYNNVYLQDKIRLRIDKDGNKVFFRIYDNKEDRLDKKPSQRSQGFQWFFAFYLMLNSIDEETIILVDEPGLYLHAKAQSDILKFFNKEIQNQIIYTTHSPYLIDIDRIDSLKLVVKDNENGTKIINKYYNCDDQDTLTPVITAIGYDVSHSPIGFEKTNNVITEGITDRFYLLAFFKLLDKKDVAGVIPATGASNIKNLCSIALGWNINFKMLFDDDSGFRNARLGLSKLFANKEEMENHIIMAFKDGSIEDIFSKNDSINYNISKNSKVESAFNFYNKVMKEEIKKNDLEDETIKNIENLLEKI